MDSPCKINTKIKLSIEESKVVNSIFNYDISFVYEKLVLDHVIKEEDIVQLDLEFKKFISLASFGIYPLAMISPLIDEVWHQFILFTKHYKDFCLTTVGHFIGHVPDTSKTPIPLLAGKNLISGYKKYFGNLPSIWYKGMDDASINYYTQPILSTKPPKKWSGFSGPE